MVKVVCDCCGQEMIRWIRVVATPQAQEQWMNVADLIKYGSARDMCEECYKDFLERTVEDV